MSVSTSWTFFEVAEGPGEPVPGHPGITGHVLVDNADDAGCSLLQLAYEPGAADDQRRHSVGQVLFVLQGELLIDGRSCGRGAGCFAPAHRTYSVRAGAEGATAVEFRPAPISYLGGRPDDEDVVAVSKPATPNRERYQRAWALIRSAGPVTSVRDLSYFDMASMPLTRVSEGQSIQTLVNHDEEDGQNVIAIHHDPGDVQALHSHDVEQFVIVLEGTLQQGNRLFPAGTGFFTPRQRNYGFRATDDAPMVRVEWRPSPSRFATDHPEPRDGEPVASGAEV